MEMNIAIKENDNLKMDGDIRIKVKAHHLSVYYGKFRALTDINMEIQERKITAIIGPSGCGNLHCCAHLTG